MLKQINGATFRKMVLAAGSLLEQNKKNVDALNVFPVPDGDTGTNMCLTFKSAVKEVNNVANNNLDALGEAVIKGALRGARGNSGVILSQILKGMATVIIANNENVTTKVFAKAINEGAAVAYKAVTKPKEGTILTVIRIMGEAALSIAKKVSDFEEFFKQVLDAGEAILQQTPEMLPVLKKAGVVDAGGRGLLVVFTGFYKVALGEEEIYYIVEDDAAKVSTEDDEMQFANLDDLGNIEFAYCTEFMIININKKTTESDIDKLRERLMEIGDSVICIGDLSLVKVHVHSNEPNKALGYALELGELNNLKIENMLEQNRQLKQARMTREQDQKPFGIVAVAPGDGLASVLKDIAVDNIISGGQTMNPSANDIAKAADKVASNNVFVFPNNKNIVLAAEQAQALTSKQLYVIPTTSVPEGIAAILAMNPESSIDENIEAINNSITNVKSGSVTYAVRSTHIDGFDLQEGDIIGLNEKNILTKSNLVSEATINLIDRMIDNNVANITLFYGEDVQESEANELAKKLEEKFPNQEINLIYGGQPVYYYLISLE